jgi:hypothetical protein
MWKATKARRALFGFLPIIALVLGYQEVFMSQAKADGGIKNVLLVHGGFVDGSGWQYAVNWSWVNIGPTSDEYVYL